MRLKSIKLAGFKSFVDPTTVSFPGNMCAVVGPNGCGKSNVIDAVRWVMGESSAKNLRGESMAELMFKIANEDAPDVRSLRPDLPDALSAVLQRALHKQPEVRYQDGEQLADALAALDSVQRDAPVSEAGAGVPSAVAATPDLAGNTTAATFAKTQQIGELAASRRRPDPTPDLEID